MRGQVLVGQVNARPVSLYRRKSGQTRLTPKLIGNSAEQEEQVQWARVAKLMQEPRLVFDGHNILDSSVTSLGLTAIGVGRRRFVTAGGDESPVTASDSSSSCSSAVSPCPVAIANATEKQL